MQSEQSLYTETLKDKFTLSPLQKYQKYGRWPYKMVIGCALVVLTSLQAIFVSNHFVYNNPILMQTWVSIFLGNDDPQMNSNVLYTVADFQDSFAQTLSNLQNIEEIVVVPISTKFVSMSLNVQFQYPNIIYRSKEWKFIYELEIGQEITEPFVLNDTQSVRRFWQKAEALKLEIRNITVFNAGVPSCWDIFINYQYKDQGAIVATADSLGGVCNSDKERMEIQNGDVDGIDGNSKAIFINGGVQWNDSLLQISIILLATFDLVFNLKYIYEVIEMYTRNIYLQTRVQQLRIPDYKMRKDANLTTLKIILKKQKPWHQLSYRERFLFFDLFLPIRIIGNSFQILSSGIILAEGFFRIDDLANYDEALVGIGCFMAWFSIAKYMEYIQQLHIISSVLESSILPLCNAVVSFMPVYMAYLFLGMCLFSQSSRFATLHSSFVALTALVYQDSQSDVIIEASMEQYVKMAMLYIIPYVLLFTFAVNNIMVALIKEQLEQRREIIDLENELMDELDIKPATQLNQSIVPTKMVQSVIVAEQSEQSLPSFGNQSQSVTIKNTLDQKRVGVESSITPQIPEVPLTRLTQSVIDQPEKRKHISLKTVSKIAVLLSRNSGNRLSQQRLESDWSRLAGQEIKKNQLYQSITELGQDIKFQLQQMENELQSEFSLFIFNRIERIELTTYYCSQLIALTERIKQVTYKFMMVEKHLQTEEVEYKRQSVSPNNRKS